MKLKTWYMVIVAPPLALCLALVLSTLDTAREFTRRIDRLEDDGAAYVAMQSHANTLNREIQTTAFALAQMELGEPYGQRGMADSGGRTETARNLAHATALFPPERSSDPDDSPAPTARATAAFAKSMALADSALALGRSQRFGEAESMLATAEDIASDSALPPIMARVQQEAQQLDAGIAALSSHATGVLRLALDNGATQDLQGLRLDRARLAHAVAFARAYQNVADLVLRQRTDASSERERSRAFTRATTAGELLINDYRDAPVPRLLRQALATLDTARRFNDTRTLGRSATRRHAPRISAEHSRRSRRMPTPLSILCPTSRSPRCAPISARSRHVPTQFVWCSA